MLLDKVTRLMNKRTVNSTLKITATDRRADTRGDCVLSVCRAL
jgi:hypothetical protein